MRILLISLFLFGAGCSTNPTQYVPSEDDLGYSDQIVDENLRVTTFKGNSATKKEMAELYSKFRALELCHEMGKTYTHILLMKDKTYSKDISQATATGPSYYYGVSPYYGGYGSGVGMGAGYGYGGYGTTTTRTYNESYTYPMFDVYFECVEKPTDAGIALHNLSQSQVNDFVKDVQGAVQVEEVLTGSPNTGAIQKNDIITKVNGERVTKVLEVYQASRKSMGKELKVELFRDGKKKEVVVKFKDVSKLVGEAQQAILNEACKLDEIKKDKKICKK
jgi:hypothetical protein